MDKENVAHVHNGISFNFNKEDNPITCENVDESEGHVTCEMI
jgi:hypothetical protein